MGKNYRLKSDQIWFSGSIDFNSGSIQNIAWATSGSDAVPLDQLHDIIGTTSSGSTIFGSNLNNTHQFTGSVLITGSLIVNNDVISEGVKYIIPSGTVYHILPNKQILWYGDVEVSGSILNEGKLTIINGNMLLGPLGAVNLLSGSLELTSYYNQNTSDKKFVPKSGDTIITGSIGVSGSNNFFSMNSPNSNLNTIQIDNYGNLIINII